jgi:hypothetical protein
MGRLGKFHDALALYRAHGWRLARVLMTPETLAELGGGEAPAGGGPGATGGARKFEGVEPRESEFDAMWLTRPAAAGREAWELRLVADTPYALFELFEPDEADEDREDVRREMEARMRETMNAEL